VLIPPNGRFAPTAVIPGKSVFDPKRKSPAVASGRAVVPPI